MNRQTPPHVEKLRQQYDYEPYPTIPVDYSPRNNINDLYIHNYVTPFYLRHQAIAPRENLTILDVGCGSGWGALMLAEANPGAKVVGIDLSPRSIEVSQERMAYHGHTNAEFHVLLLDHVTSLDMQFDYINCDEILYFLDNPTAAFRDLKAVLKPNGIIRGNFHSALERAPLYRAQQVFGLMGLMDGNPEAMEAELVRDTMHALRDGVNLKARTWNPMYEGDRGNENILKNFLLQGDRGFTIPEVFQILREADLEFISMVNWRHWELMDLFHDPNNLPILWGMTLPELPAEAKLHLFELIHPVYRLIDFWCGHPNSTPVADPIHTWQPNDWDRAIAHLHPQLRRDSVRSALEASIAQQQRVEVSKFLTHPVTQPLFLPADLTATLLPLWDAPQSFPALLHRWMTIRPVNAITLAPVAPETARTELIDLLTRLEVFLYVLLEKS